MQDERLREAVLIQNGKNWKKIAEHLPERGDIQCLHRWHTVLNAELVRGSWTEEVYPDVAFCFCHLIISEKYRRQIILSGSCSFWIEVYEDKDLKDSCSCSSFTLTGTGCLFFYLFFSGVGILSSSVSACIRIYMLMMSDILNSFFMKFSTGR